MIARVINQRAGRELAVFNNYVDTAEYRKQLRRTVDPGRPCPFAIRIDGPERAAADRDFAEFFRESESCIAALPQAMVHGELFDVPTLWSDCLSERNALVGVPRLRQLRLTSGQILLSHNAPEAPASRYPVRTVVAPPTERRYSTG